MTDINFQKKKTLVLTQTDPSIDVMFKSWLDYNLQADVIFKNVSKPLRALRRIVATKMPASFLSWWVNDWTTKLSNYNTVIIHASELTNHLPKYIHQLNPHLRIIYWYWNPVNSHTLPTLVTDDNVEFWTFDEDDKKRYHMRSNIQYYTGVSESQRNNLKYDVYFIGHDKGRKNQINEILNQIKNLGLSYKADIISDSSKNYIAYDVVKKRIMASKAILEINQKGQIGYTLRTLESLFLDKKLITNNLSIKKADFYCPNNIFIIGNDHMESLKDFLHIPYDHSVDEFKKKYTVDSWFNNFFIEK